MAWKLPCLQNAMSFIAELKCAFRSFTRAQGLALTVIVTLALGVGANAASSLSSGACFCGRS